MLQSPKSPLRILLEMRPALAGHAGIPQATRLLFRNLASLDGVHIEGLLQSGERLLTPGLPPTEIVWFGRLSPDQQLNRLGRVVIAIEQDHWDGRIRATAQTVLMALKHMLGGSQTLSRFDARHFQDFLWRRLFARTLAPEDFDLVTKANFRVARIPWLAMHICALATRKLGYPIYPRLNTSDFDVMIAETPYPATVSRNTRLVVRYHDAIPLLMPHTISDRRFHQAFHYRALRNNVRSGAWFVCVSDTTRRDLVSIFPEVESRSITIHNIVSHHYTSEASEPDRIPEIIRSRINMRLKPRLDLAITGKLVDEISTLEKLSYLLVVSTIEPRKNHLSLLSAWERLRVNGYPALKLIIVGSLGWHHKQIIRKFRPWLERGDAFLLEDVLATELRILYAHARATVCPSFGEGFDFSGVEAMKSGSPVIASDIPVHHEIYAEAAEYFNPYSADALSFAIQSVIDATRTARRAELVAKGFYVADRYAEASILPKWQSFLESQTMASPSMAWATT